MQTETPTPNPNVALMKGEMIKMIKVMKQAAEQAGLDFQSVLDEALQAE